MPDEYPLFKTRTMLAALELRTAPRTFVKDTFFQRASPVYTERVDVDIYTSQRRVAVYVDSTAEGNVMSREGYTTFSYKVPYIKEKMVIEPTDLENRTYGETIYQAESPQQRALRQLAIDMGVLDDAITRAEELQAVQALFQGKIQLKNGDWLIFPEMATHLITDLEFEWTDTENSDPLADLGVWRRMIVRDGRIAPDVVMMGSDAMTTFLNHPKISGNQAAFSQVKINRGMIDPQMLADGVIYWGFIAEIGCDIYSYDEWYVPPTAPANSEAVPMVPLNQILMGASRARRDIIYAPIKDMRSLIPVARFPKTWITQDPSAQWLMLQSAPLLIPTQVNATVSATVCALSNEQLG